MFEASGRGWSAGHTVRKAGPPVPMATTPSTAAVALAGTATSARPVTAIVSVAPAPRRPAGEVPKAWRVSARRTGVTGT